MRLETWYPNLDPSRALTSRLAPAHSPVTSRRATSQVLTRRRDHPRIAKSLDPVETMRDLDSVTIPPTRTVVRCLEPQVIRASIGAIM
jgi:hypothetical protein